MAYKGTAHAWLRNLGKLDDYADWTAEPPLPDGPEASLKELKMVKCPCCEEAQSTKEHKLKSNAGFSQLKCQACDEVKSADMWLCECRIQWHKCGEHVHRHFLNEHLQSNHSVPIVSKLSARGIKRKFPEHGVDRPMPKKRGTVALHLEGARRDENRPFLGPHSKLAAKFPHLVKKGPAS